MSVSVVGVSEGSDAFLHTDVRTISAVAREDQFVQLGEPTYPTYTVLATNISVATTADHVLQVMGDGTNYSRIVGVRVRQVALASAASQLGIQVIRLSTAGTGGSAVTPRPLDAGDSAYAGGAMTLPSSKGTEGVELYRWRLGLVAAQPVVETLAWVAPLRGKPIIFGTGTGNGIAFKVTTGVTSATVDIVVDMIVTSYL